VNLARDFSPGTASWVTSVPECDVMTMFPTHQLLAFVLLTLLMAEPAVAGPLSHDGTVAGSDSNQSNRKTRTTVHDGALSIREYIDLPEATEPCTPEACHWWNEIETTGNALNKKADKKLKARFLFLIHEGQQKSYRAPVKDRLPQVLGDFGRPAYPQAFYEGKVSGSAAISIEYRADGSVGEIKIVKSLGFGIDEGLMRGFRKSVFLPAVESGAFVTFRATLTVEFHTGPFPSRR